MSDQPISAGSTVTTPVAPPAPASPPPPPPASGGDKPVASNADPGVDLTTGVREDDVADTAKRDEAVEKLAAAYDDPDQQERVRARFADKDKAGQ